MPSGNSVKCKLNFAELLFMFYLLICFIIHNKFNILFNFNLLNLKLKEYKAVSNLAAPLKFQLEFDVPG